MTEVHQYRGIGVKEYRSTGVQEYLYAHKYRSAEVQEYSSRHAVTVYLPGNLNHLICFLFCYMFITNAIIMWQPSGNMYSKSYPHGHD